MKTMICALSVVAVFAVSTTAYASSVQHEQLVREVILLSGNEMIVEQVAGIFTGGEKAKQGEDRTISQLLAKNFDIEKGRKTLYERVSIHCDDRMLQAMLRWYKSPAGQKINGEELKAGKASIDEKRQYLRGLDAQPPSKERFKLMVSFVDRSQLPDKMHKILIEATTAFAVAFTNNGKNGSLEKVSEYLESGVFDLNELRREEVLLSFYTYRAISDSEMKEYTDFVATPEYQSFQNEVLSSVGMALKTAFSATGAELAKALRQTADAGEVTAIASLEELVRGASQ